MLFRYSLIQIFCYFFLTVLQNCLSKKNQAGVKCNKEDVWVSHLFAAASAVLPSNCFIDPQYTATVSDKKRKKPEEKKKTEKGKEKKKIEKGKEKKKTEEKVKQKDHGEVDIIVHNGVRYFIELLISESSPKNLTGKTATVEAYPFI